MFISEQKVEIGADYTLKEEARCFAVVRKHERRTALRADLLERTRGIEPVNRWKSETVPGPPSRILEAMREELCKWSPPRVLWVIGPIYEEIPRLCNQYQSGGLRNALKIPQLGTTRLIFTE
jgi:hypothetical protein